MSTLDLLIYPTSERAQNFFADAHAQEHAILASKIPPSSHATAAHWFLDPALGANQPASPWNLNHQQAHDADANAFSVQPSLMLIEGTPTTSDWLWTNHWHHLALRGALLAQG